MLPARLLVDLPNWVGDVIMGLPAVARLVAANAAGETVLHCRPPVAGLLGAVFPDTEVVATPKGIGPAAAASAVRRGGPRFDLGVTLRHAVRAKLVLRAAARTSLGSTSEGGRLLLTRAFPVDRERHQAHDADPILEFLGLAPADPAWRPDLPQPVLEAGARAVAGVGRGRPVGLVPSAAWGESKRWPEARFGSLAVELLGHGLQPVLLVGPGEAPVAQAVAESAGRELPVLGPDLDILGLAGVMTHLPVVVSNDSGPMHLAAMAGSRVVGLFGPTDPRRTAPLGEGNVVISRELSCAPCFEPVCPLGTRACMEEIGVDEVLGMVLAALGES